MFLFQGIKQLNLANKAETGVKNAVKENIADSFKDMRRQMDNIRKLLVDSGLSPEDVRKYQNEYLKTLTQETFNMLTLISTSFPLEKTGNVGLSPLKKEKIENMLRELKGGSGGREGGTPAKP